MKIGAYIILQTLAMSTTLLAPATEFMRKAQSRRYGSSRNSRQLKLGEVEYRKPFKYWTQQDYGLFNIRVIQRPLGS